MASPVANVTPTAMDSRAEPPLSSAQAVTVPPIRLPALLTFAALAAGLAIGWLLSGSAAIGPVLAVAGPVGAVWLNALQVTIIPLVAALLVSGIAGMVATAHAGPMARRTIALFYGVLGLGTLVTVLALPPVLQLLPIPPSAQSALAVGGLEPQAVPGIGAFLESLVAPNIIAAAAQTAMLPLVLFFAAFAVAITRLPDAHSNLLLGFFAALGNAMLVMIGWVLRLAPVGVFALAIGVAVRAGSGAVAVLGHYVLVVSGFGFIVFLAAYLLAMVGGRQPLLRFAQAILPVQAVAISTQSSLACLPAMLTACRTLEVRERTADFVLPLAVAIFRATSPAMNLAVAIYVARLTGVALTPGVLAAGAAVALITTVGSVSLPGSISFITSIGPVALAMGVPIEPLALLVAVEMLPDLMRTAGNVTMDVAVTATLDRLTPADQPDAGGGS